MPADDPERPALLLRHGRALVRSGLDADAELSEATEQLLAAGEVESAAEATLARWWLAWNQGRAADADALVRQALELVSDRPASTTKAELHGYYAISVMLRGRVDESIHHSELELEIGREIGAERHRAHALITLGTTRAGWMHDAAGLAQVEEGLELARRLGEGEFVLRGYKNLQSLLGLHAELDRARAVIEDGSRTALRFGDPHHIGWFQVERALLDYLGGDWDEAAESFRSFLDNLGERDHYMIGPAQLRLGRIEVERGQVVEGVRRSTVGLEFARGVKDHQLLMPALASHACVLIRAGRTTEAHPVLDEYLGLADFPDSSVVDAAIALTLLDRAHDFPLRGTILTTPWGTAAAAFARADYAEAAARFEAIGARVYEAEARLRLAEQLAAAGRVADAESEARAAAAFFAHAGAVPRVAEAEAVVRASA